MEKLKPCPFCGKQFYIYEEEECGAHPCEIWFTLNHSCFVDIELLQKGGNKEDFIKRINTRLN